MTPTAAEQRGAERAVSYAERQIEACAKRIKAARAIGDGAEARIWFLHGVRWIRHRMEARKRLTEDGR